MEMHQLFLQRYDALAEFWIGHVWNNISEQQLRSRPHNRLNSIVWNLWHISRVEDAGINRFVVDRPQALYDGGWFDQMGVPYRHHGTGMTLEEVDDLSETINVEALRNYWQAVNSRTLEIIAQLVPENLNAIMDSERLQVILVDEGVAYPNAQWLSEAYQGWNKGKSKVYICDACVALAKRFMEDTLQDDTQPQETEFPAWHNLFTRIRKLLQGKRISRIVLQLRPDNAVADCLR
jgi:hypothetical protein